MNLLLLQVADFSDFYAYDNQDLSDSVSILSDMMGSAFKLPECMMEDVLKEFQESCHSIYNHTDYYYYDYGYGYGDWGCMEQIDDLTDIEDKFCHAYGVLNTIQPQFTYGYEPFKAGVVLKTNWRKQKRNTIHYPIYQDTLDILNVLTEKDDAEYSFNCSYADVVLRNLKPCKLKLLDNYWLENMDLVYSLKNQIIAPPSKSFKEKNEMKHIGLIKQTMQKHHKYIFKGEDVLNDYTTVLACKFGDNEINEDCTLFSNTFVSTGIGYTFNAQPFWTIFQNVSSNFAFYKVLHEEEERQEIELPRKIINAGQAFSFEFIMRHNPYGYQYRGEGDSFRFIQQDVFLSIHDPSHFPNLKSEGILIEPGMSYKVRIQPTLTVTDKSGLALDNQTRNCLTKEEKGEMKLFNSYSQSACLFECKLRQATSICKCSSWDYPRFEPLLHICLEEDTLEDLGIEPIYSESAYLNYEECFNDIMQNETLVNNCDCPNDCEQIVYDIDVQASPLLNTGRDQIKLVLFSITGERIKLIFYF